MFLTVMRLQKTLGTQALSVSSKVCFSFRQDERNRALSRMKETALA
jgi:hypothetical protein